MSDTARDEVARGERFAFGRNWARFLSVLNEERIIASESALRTMLGVQDLNGRTFLDVGSGSGIVSLAARRLGARVLSFDYDSDSVACTRELKRRYMPNDPSWTIEQGSALDIDYLAGKGQFDVVYSWGVLHHTGNMWQAMENVCLRVAAYGSLLIAIYNDQGLKSVAWGKVKTIYCSNPLGKLVVSTLFFPYFVLGAFMKDLFKGRNPFARYVGATTRGMSFLHDIHDWLGGLPFEVASPPEVVAFLEKRGFLLRKVVSVGRRLGNNEFLFVRGNAT